MAPLTHHLKPNNMKFIKQTFLTLLILSFTTTISVAGTNKPAITKVVKKKQKKIKKKMTRPLWKIKKGKVKKQKKH